MNDKIKDAFDAVHAEDALKEDTKAFLAKNAYNAHPRRRTNMVRLAGSFACLALIIFGAWRFYTIPVSAISVDVNPSVELNINRLDKVASAESFNADGDALLSGIELKNMDYSEALDALLSSEAMEPYIENDGLVSITVIGSNDAKSEEMRQRIALCAYADRPNVECQCGNRAEVENAHEAGLSFGKYQAFLRLEELDPTVTVEEISGMTMRQIRDRITTLSGSAEDAVYGKGQHGANKQNGK